MNTNLRIRPSRFYTALRLAGVLGALGAAALVAPHVNAADIGVHIDIGGPPPPRHEVMVERPGPDYIWVNGYWGGEPGHYEWVRGHWERPHHRGARWVEPRWERRDGRWVMIRGYWR